MNNPVFRPKLLDTLKGYDQRQFSRDLMAGIIVGIVALPLAIAFGIASGVSPEKGLFTAVIAGFIISALGGSRVQIGGPTGAFIVIVYGIVQEYGTSGLIIATFLAGIMLILMGMARLGSIIKFIPYPLIIGFTSGIALIIFSSQLKDFLGLQMDTVPADFTGKWKMYFRYATTINPYATGIAIATVLLIILWPRITRKVPGSLIAIITITAVTHFFHLPVETINSRFGTILAGLPSPVLPSPDFATVRELIQPAFTIALLGGIESLLSAVVADGMTGGNHRSNTELIGQGTANIFSSLFGGIPATGAIARTATNIKNGGRTPVAGMVHALVLLLIILIAGKWAALIPMPVLAGILVVVAYNMSEWKNFRSVLKGPGSDTAVLVITFLLTILVDLTVAIEIGMLVAVLLFFRNMITASEVKQQEDIYNTPLSPGAEVFEITGPLFFGAIYKFKDAIQFTRTHPQVLIIRMGRVPFIDATGINTLKEIIKQCRQKGTLIILSEVQYGQVLNALKDAQLLLAIGNENITHNFEEAIQRSNAALAADH